jgi:hypothetical protein
MRVREIRAYLLEQPAQRPKGVPQNLKCGLVFPKLAFTPLFQGYIRHPETRILFQLFLMSGQKGPI